MLKKKTLSLSKNEEYILIKNFKNRNDINAIKKLIESNLNYIIKIAKKYSGYEVMTKDLIQEGAIGLIKAIKKFDSKRKVRLISFAIYWIKSEIHEYIIKNLRVVKIATTKTQKHLFFNLNKFKKIGWLNSKEKKTISNFLNIKKKEIGYMESKLKKKDTSIENSQVNKKVKTFNIYDKKHITFVNYNPPSLIEKNNWKKHVSNNLKNALIKLDERSQSILKKRWLLSKKLTLGKLAKIHNISSERIRQLESSAIKKLKNMIKLGKFKKLPAKNEY